MRRHLWHRALSIQISGGQPRELQCWTLNVLLLQANWLDSEGRKTAEDNLAGWQASRF